MRRISTEENAECCYLQANVLGRVARDPRIGFEETRRAWSRSEKGAVEGSD